MVSYQERKAKAKYFVLIKSGEVIGLYGSLKKLCESQEDESFPSYWTLTRKMKGRIDFDDYSIQETKLI